MSATWVVAGILGLAIANSLLRADPEARGEKLVAIAWGSALAIVGYLLWRYYTLEDVRAAVSWLTGDGLPFVGVAILGVAGYVWYQSAQAADGDPDRFFDELRDRTTGPVLQFAGILTAIVVTLLTLLWTSGTSAAMILGFLGDTFTLAPIVWSNLWAILVGWIAIGGQVPLVGDLIPDFSWRWYLGLTIGALGVAVMARNAGGRS